MTEQKNPRHLFLTGRKQVGKSTAINRALADLGLKFSGFRTKPFYIEDQRAGFYLEALSDLVGPEGSHKPISVRIDEKTALLINESFLHFTGGALDAAARDDSSLILLDELGFMEQSLPEFHKRIHACLDADKPVLGVMRLCPAPWLAAIKDRTDVEVLTVTEENRDDCPAYIRAFFEKQLSR